MKIIVSDNKEAVILSRMFERIIINVLKSENIPKDEKNWLRDCIVKMNNNIIADKREAGE